MNHDPRNLNAWQRIRRYAVPGWMIDDCTAARERGDWRAACDVAGIDVEFDDPGPVAGLLAGFAPDLLRWYLPRTMGGATGLAPWKRYVLAPDRAAGTVLLLRTHDTERLTLETARLESLPAGPNIVVPSYLWDVRQAMALRGPASFEPPAPPPPGAEIEPWIRAGWVFGGERPSGRRFFDHQTSGLDPLLVAHELRRAAARFGIATWPVFTECFPIDICLTAEPDRLRIDVYDGAASRDRPTLMLHPDLMRPPVDLFLVREGLLAVDELHPLVREALFPASPARTARSEPGGLPAEEMFRVRCRGVWHWVGLSAGRIELPEHDAGERQREQSLAAFGGTMSGCFQAEQAWVTGHGRLPKRLQQARRDLLLRLEHGDVRGLTEMLDAGLDPFLRDGGGRTLIHMLRTFGDPSPLSRLTAAGVDIDSEDKQGFTALYEAVQHRWPSRYIIALADAGAGFGSTPSRRFLDISERHGDADLKAAIAYLRKRA